MADETTGKVEEVKGDEHVGSNAKEGAGAELVPSQAKVSEGPPGVDGKPEEVSEENRLWQIVQRNPTDFSTWTQLLVLAEQPHQENMKKFFEFFLNEFPLCYGYWKKYADCVKRATGSVEAVLQIFDRGVESVAVSVDLWIQYVEFAVESQKSTDFIRSLYKRAVAVCGTDFHAGPLWDKYIEFESASCGVADQGRIGAIYWQILSIPTLKNIPGYYSQYQTWRQTRPPTEWLPVEDITTLVEGGTEGKTPKEVESAAREAATKRIDELYAKTSEAADRRRLFEAGIKRPYFHVESLDAYELQNWHNYLDFEEKNGTFESTVALYERCVVTTCLYSEYWVRYSKYLERQRDNGPAKAREVLHRATSIYCKRGTPVHLELAGFEERHGDIEESRRAYATAMELSPGLVECPLKLAQLERRAGNLVTACDIYEATLRNIVEDPTENKKSVIYIFMHYARFVKTFLRDVEKARAIYDRAIALCPKSKLLLLALISFEQSVNAEDMFEKVGQIRDSPLHYLAVPQPSSLYPSTNTVQLRKVQNVYEKAIGKESSLSEGDKADLFRSYAEFAADFAPQLTIAEDVLQRCHEAYPTRTHDRKGSRNGSMKN